MSEGETFKPRKKWLADRIKELRKLGAGEYLWGDVEGNVALAQFQAEMTLLNLETQNLLQKTLEKSIESQDRLANSNRWLTFVGVFIALLQLVGMFIIPYLQNAI